MKNNNQELNQLLHDEDGFKSTEDRKSEENLSIGTYAQLIEELKSYSNIVASFRRKSLLGKESLQLKVT
jgi:hypothetical protein